MKSQKCGLGMLYASIQAGRFCYVHNSARWYKWAGHYWAEDGDFKLADRAVEDVVTILTKEVATIGGEIAKAAADGNDDLVKKLQRVQKSCLSNIGYLRSSKGVDGCLRMSTSGLDSMAVPASQFDQDPWAFACSNGVLDLRTGDLRPGRPDEYITRHSPIAWQGIEAPAPNWDRAILEIFDGDAELVAFLYKFYGMALSAVRTRHLFLVHHGRGRNGKDTVLRAIKEVMGSYAVTIPAEMLLEGNFTADAAKPSPHIMLLCGARLAVASETDDGRKFSTSKVKWYTGGGKLTGRGLQEKRNTEFTPTHLLALDTNSKPHAPHSDFAFWERSALVPHLLSFVQDRDPVEHYERRADAGLDKKIAAEYPGILARLVRGCLAWQKEGIVKPSSVVSATNEYRDDEDVISPFIAQCCIESPGQKLLKHELYEGFTLYWERNVSKKVPSSPWLGTQMTAYGRFERYKSCGLTAYKGITFTPEWQDEIDKARDRRDRSSRKRDYDA